MALTARQKAGIVADAVGQYLDPEGAKGKSNGDTRMGREMPGQSSEEYAKQAFAKPASPNL